MRDRLYLSCSPSAASRDTLPLLATCRKSEALSVWGSKRRRQHAERANGMPQASARRTTGCATLLAMPVALILLAVYVQLFCGTVPQHGVVVGLLVVEICSTS
jgi:hypothetical protein